MATIAQKSDLPSTLLSISNITHAALRRSDFWEEPALRGTYSQLIGYASFPTDQSAHAVQLLLAIRGAAILPGLSTVQDVLAENVADSKTAGARKSLQLGALVTTARFYRSLAESVPAEFFGAATKAALVESALALDLWLSSRLDGTARVAELGDAQCALRGFVLLSGPQSVRAPRCVQTVTC